MIEHLIKFKDGIGHGFYHNQSQNTGKSLLDLYPAGKSLLDLYPA